jgi:hypothetical protein
VLNNLFRIYNCRDILSEKIKLETFIINEKQPGSSNNFLLHFAN